MQIPQSLTPRSCIKAVLLSLVGPAAISYENCTLEAVEQLYRDKYGDIHWYTNSKQLEQLEKLLSYALRFNGPANNKLIFCLLNQAIRQGIGVVLGKLTPEAAEVHNRARQVWAEIHRVKGFMRFWPVKNMPGAMAGQGEFQHHIGDIVLKYFLRRYPDQKIFIINGQQVMFLHDTGIKVVPRSEIPLDFDEHDFDELWEAYYDCQSIAGRENKKLARKHIPKKLWSWVPEGEKLK